MNKLLVLFLLIPILSMGENLPEFKVDKTVTYPQMEEALMKAHKNGDTKEVEKLFKYMSNRMMRAEAYAGMYLSSLKEPCVAYPTTNPNGENKTLSCMPNGMGGFFCN
jgi:hypothetical protein